MHSEPSEISKSEHFAKIGNYIQPVTNFAKNFTLGVSQSSEFPLLKLNKSLVRYHLFRKKVGLQSLQISSTLKLVLSPHFYIAVKHY